MNKKMFIGLFPALLALSACGGLSPNNEPTQKDIFLGDTLAHDEIFGASSGESLLKSIRNLDPVLTSEPLIAVQKQSYKIDTTDYYAVRFVAAVKLNSLATSLNWDSDLYEDDGDYLKSYDTLSAQKVYTAIYDGNSLLTIADFNTAQGGTDYTHFVTYTIRKIPTDKTGYYLSASLSVGGAAATKIIATSVDLNKQASFPVNQSGYFLTGRFGGATPTNIKTADSEPVSGNYASFTDLSLTVGDTFVLVKKDASSLLIYNYESLNGSESLAFFDNLGNKMKTKFDGTYGIYLKNTDSKIYSTVNSSGLENGYYLVGDFCDWKFFAVNKLGAGKDGNWAQIENVPFTSNGNVHVQYFYNGSGTNRFGPNGKDQSYDNYGIWHNGLYSFYVKDDKLYTAFNRPFTIEIYDGSNQEVGDIYILLSNSNEETPELNRLTILSSYDKSGNNYVVDTTGYNYIYAICVYDSSIIRSWSYVDVSTIVEGGVGFTVTADYDEEYSNYWTSCDVWKNS